MSIQSIKHSMYKYINSLGLVSSQLKSIVIFNSWLEFFSLFFFNRKYIHCVRAWQVGTHLVQIFVSSQDKLLKSWVGDTKIIIKLSFSEMLLFKRKKRKANDGAHGWLKCSCVCVCVLKCSYTWMFSIFLFLLLFFKSDSPVWKSVDKMKQRSHGNQNAKVMDWVCVFLPSHATLACSVDICRC